MELTGASQLTAGEGVAVQGITLRELVGVAAMEDEFANEVTAAVAAAALMHLPVGVLQEFSIVVGLAAWAFTS